MKAGKLIPLLVAASITPAHAMQFNTGDKHSASLDVTLTYGAQWRLDDPEKELLADPNLDDANRNFDSGLTSNSFRAIADFEWRYNSDGGNTYGLFARGSAWYDDKIYNSHNDNDSEAIGIGHYQGSIGGSIKPFDTRKP